MTELAKRLEVFYEDDIDDEYGNENISQFDEANMSVNYDDDTTP